MRVALSRAIHSKQVSCAERDERLSRSHRRAQSQGQRHRLAAGARRPDAAGQGSRRRACARRGLRRHARLPAGGEGPHRDQGHPHHAGLADLQGFRAGRRRHRGRAGEARRRDHHRQDQHAGVRARLQHLQRRVRPHAERLRPDQEPRADRAAAARSPSRCTCCRSPTAPTTAARCAIPPPTTTSSASGRRSGGCRRSSSTASTP